MRSALSRLLTVVTVPVLLATGTVYAPTVSAGAVEDGRKVAFDRKKGNCLACHLIQGAAFANSNIAPPLIAMKARFPDKAKLRAQVWDATVKNPNSLMPPFGKHNALTEKEIDLVVEFLYSL